MSETRSQAQPRKQVRIGVLLTVAALFIIVAGMREAQEILVPFLIAVFLAIVCSPAVLWLTSKRVPRFIAVLLVVGAMVGVGTGFAALVGTSLNSFSRNVPAYQMRLQGEASDLLAWPEARGINLSSDLLLNHVDPGAAMDLAANLLTGVGAVFTNAFLILLTVVFILLEVSSFPGKLRAVMGDPESAFPQFAAFTDSLKDYLAIKTVISLVTGVLVTIWVGLLGIDFALLWGLLAFLLNYIPNVGSIIAGVPAVLLAFIQHGFATAVIVAIGYFVLNTVLGNVVEPRIMGQGLGLSALVVFLSLIFWGWLWGTVGMLLSVPLTMTVKIALENKEETRWLAVLLGPPISEQQEAET